MQIDDGHLAPVLIQAWDNGGAVVQRGALVCKIPEQQACQREPGALMLCPLHGV